MRPETTHFRRLALFPVLPNGRADPAAVCAPLPYGGTVRELLPLPERGGGLARSVWVNVPLIVCLLVASSFLWSTSAGRLTESTSAPAIWRPAREAGAAGIAIRRAMAAFPDARHVVLAQRAVFRAGGHPAVQQGLVGASAPTGAVPFTIFDSGVPIGTRVAAGTVAEALRAVGVSIQVADVVVPAPETPLVPGLKISIQRAKPVTLAGHDLWQESPSIAGTVRELLAERGVVLGPLDRVEPPPEAPFSAGAMVRLVRVREEERRELQFVPYRTYVQHDSRLAPGRQVRLSGGLMGIMERLLRVVIEDETEARSDVMAETIVREPIDEVIAQGSTAISIVARPGLNLPSATTQWAFAGAPPPGTNVRRVLTMEATAYDPGPISTGKRPGDPAYGITASGMRATTGVVAVDPRVVPFYTRMYIPGYGFAVAADTGSAILGNRIDLFYNTYEEAIQWGRRSVPVYILD